MLFPGSGFLPDKENILIITGKQLASIKKIEGGNFMKNLIAWFKDEEGQGMVEYALIIGLISIVAIVILVSLGGKVNNKYAQADGNLN